MDFTEGDIIVYKNGKYIVASQMHRPLSRKLGHSLLKTGRLKKRVEIKGGVIYTYSQP